MSNIEEDIEILENLKSYLNLLVYEGKDKIIYNDLLWDEKTVDCINAIENILQDYTRQKQINEEHQKINGELREKVKELEEERQIVGMPVKNKRNGNIGVILHQWKSGSVAVLENINPRVINTHDSWNTLEIITDEIKQIQTKNDSIPKQKIQDKINELKMQRRELGFKTYLRREDMINDDREIVIKIQVLQELLQESEDK